MRSTSEGPGEPAGRVRTAVTLPLARSRNGSGAPEREGPSRARLGIRFHLLLATLLLAILALGIGGYYAHVRLGAQKAEIEHNLALDASLVALHKTFVAASALPGLFSGLAQAEDADRLTKQAAALALSIEAVRRVLARIPPGHRQPLAPGVSVAEPPSTGPSALGADLTALQRAERATDLAERAARHLGDAVSGRLKAEAAAVERTDRLSPSLAELRRQELETESRVRVALDEAGAAKSSLDIALYDLARHLLQEERRTAIQRARSNDRANIFLQGWAIGAGLFVLALAAYYLHRRVVRPLERLTKAIRHTSRRLSGGDDSGVGPETLPDTGAREDEVAVLTQALRELHGAVAEREQVLLEQQTRLHRLAYHDALTGLPNRALVSDRIEQAMSGARRRGLALVVGLLDLDGFKAVNDRLGHAAGDALLVEVAHRLRTVLRETDTLGRLGGDELALLLPDLEREEDAWVVLERVHACFQEPFDLGEAQRIATSASIGYTLFPDDDCPGDVLIRHADQAMYRAKGLGKDRLQRYRPD